MTKHANAMVTQIAAEGTTTERKMALAEFNTEVAEMLFRLKHLDPQERVLALRNEVERIERLKVIDRSEYHEALAILQAVVNRGEFITEVRQVKDIVEAARLRRRVGLR